ncbi:hypothetical protein H4R99_004415 [Coemansia sp. RSA 1722]|nr:hypothetical protein IWW45_008451 [Coemansia sp. RSA 485]KAJ2597659.1 hypothetical protein H4R99_004415 [Coemansia sp. RSA 1722]
MDPPPLPDRHIQLADAQQRDYRSSRRASLTASWSEDMLHRQGMSDGNSNGSSAEGSVTGNSFNELEQRHNVLSIHRTQSRAPTSPLPPPPLTPLSPLAPVLPPRTSPIIAERQSMVSRPLPAPPAVKKQPPTPPPRTSLSRELARAPVPPPRPLETISTPEPAALSETGLQDPRQGTFESQEESMLQMHPDTHADYNQSSTFLGKSVPKPVHHSGLHHASASLPSNALRMSPPPLPLAPRPPLQTRSQTHVPFGSQYMEDDDAGLGDSGLGPVEKYMFARASSTPSNDVRRVAIIDAQQNPASKMFSDRVLNFRDIGASVIKLGLKLNKDRVRAEHEGPLPGVVFRSAELGSACEHDVKMLFSRYGIRTIIDLRSELEARASDIMMRHYPASIQPTADQSMEKLMKLRAAQVRQTIVEVAAHDYETAARPWEKTGESRTSWSHRNSLRYTRSIGDPKKDPLARALVHLYDEDSDSAVTQNITIETPYVPQVEVRPELLGESPSSPTSHRMASADQSTGSAASLISGAADSEAAATATEPGDMDSAGSGMAPISAQESNVSTSGESADIAPQHPPPGLAQTALDWGSDTLQSLRSYWDQQWLAGSLIGRASVANGGSTNAIGTNTAAESDHQSAVQSRQQETRHQRNPSGSSDSSDDSFYRNSEADANRDPSTSHGLRPVSAAQGFAHTPPPRIVISADDSADQSNQDVSLRRTSTDPAIDSSANTPDSESLSLLYKNGEPSASPESLNSTSPTSPTSPTASLVVTNKFDGNRRRYRCNVIGENYRKKCVWANTPWSTRIKVIWRFATFNKAEAIRTIGREVLAPRGLAGSYEDYVDYCKEEFAAVMRIFADPAAYPILFHCQHGKDRTGIVAMLLLGVLEVDDDVIAADYALSQHNLASVRERMELLDMGAVGLPSSFCDTPPEVMLNLLRHIKTNYGSVRGYLRSAGLQEQEINTIAWCLRGNFCGIARANSRQAHTNARRLYLRPSAAHSDFFNKRSPPPLPPRAGSGSRSLSVDRSNPANSTASDNP